MQQDRPSPVPGGFFYKSTDPKFLARWMEDRLGVPFGTQLYASLYWKSDPADAYPAQTNLGLFPLNTDYFSPSQADFMWNLRVPKLFDLLEQLRAKGVEVVDHTESFEYGHFGWVMDPEGHKVELWEPHDAGFGELPSQTVQSRPGTDGLGGIFLKSQDPTRLAIWYHDMLSLPMQGTMALFKSYHSDSGKEQYQVFCLFKEDSDYFAPSPERFMLNFRTDRLDELVRDLREHGETMVGTVESHPQGRFAWVLDPEGRKIELWEPA